MLDYSPQNKETEKNIIPLLHKIEEKRQRRLFCFYQDYRKGEEEINNDTCEKFQIALRELGNQEKLSVFVESPGGDIDCAFRVVRMLRRYSPDVEAIVARWAKSGATFLCLGADTIYMGRDAELGPLDTQLSDPRGSVFPKSALNAFKSVEYLRQYLLETLDQVVMTLMSHGKMDIPYAIDAARPLVADIVSPLYQQVDPHELGEARRHLAVGEEYSKLVMKRYGYHNLTVRQIEKIVEKLVWDYPSHSYVIDLDEARAIGLNARPLDEETDNLCLQLLSLVNGCIGFAPEVVHENKGENVTHKSEALKRKKR